MLSFLKNLLGRSESSAPRRGPLGLHLHAGFTIDTLLFRLCEEELLVTLPGEEYTIGACGSFDLGAGCMIHRYYTTGDEFLQISTSGGLETQNIDDIKLFVYEESAGVSSEKNWRDMLSAKAMGKPFLRWRDCEWQRVFNAEERGDIEPIYTLETVNNPAGASWEVHNFMMAYQRQVADDVYEYLLLNGEETFNAQNQPEWIYSRALGVDIPLTSLKVIG
ncbi:DUF2491 family protein [Kosakonia sp.]|uniref:DUF2491 family protein n=1 Tax=Kosakonia sp. TaxID=1916651 RepID=UPI00289B23A4|nr:DUF2491 family protein [Kosakonia sp.]